MLWTCWLLGLVFSLVPQSEGAVLVAVTVRVHGYVSQFIRSPARFSVGGKGSERARWRRAFAAAVPCPLRRVVAVEWLNFDAHQSDPDGDKHAEVGSDDAGGGSVAALAFTLHASKRLRAGVSPAWPTRLRSARFRARLAHAVGHQYRLPGLLRPEDLEVTAVDERAVTAAPTTAPTPLPPPPCRPGYGRENGGNGNDSTNNSAQGNLCVQCRAGRFRSGDSDDMECQPCPAGRFGATVGRFQAECEGPCPAGRFSNAGAVRCPVCPQGKHQPLQASPSCRDGHRDVVTTTTTTTTATTKAILGIASREPHARAHARADIRTDDSKPDSDAIANANVLLCDPGSGVHALSGRCEACAVGEYSLGFSRRACERCPAGRYGLGSSSSQMCSGLCPRGRWGAGGSRSAQCDGACAAGRYGDERGARDSLCAGHCGAGRFGATRGATSAGCDGGCTRGTFSRRGALRCDACPAGKWSLAGASQCSRIFKNT